MAHADAECAGRVVQALRKRAHAEGVVPEYTAVSAHAAARRGSERCSKRVATIGWKQLLTRQEDSAASNSTKGNEVSAVVTTVSGERD